MPIPAESIPLTEQENPRTEKISSLSTADIVRLMNDEDARVPAAVREALPQVAQAVDGIVDRMQNGGRLFYIGTGTSGRLGVLDASECPPTFGVSPDLVQAIIAGGYDACHRAVEASEDDTAAGAHDLEQRGFAKADALVGIAASGRTPYTVGAVEHARGIGALTIAITCVPESAISTAAEIPIVALVGPEVIAGSTRLKAGTAQKLILNMLSTATMIKLGYVTGNRMTNVQTRNVKLHARAIRILQAEAGLSAPQAQSVLDEADGQLPLALVMSKSGRSKAESQAALAAASGVIGSAIDSLKLR
ncbi:MAG TPA: N-acetylmuramic acid 6-phosphate etherase [Pyrinomonadaceae bacterium]|jgi:N-acetylmuramic acid 6-phosphate etherase|nr:N-acetylmuramic acid 6-phosphate etherase [Pyrinomonadaceae bacterium]